MQIEKKGIRQTVEGCIAGLTTPRANVPQFVRANECPLPSHQQLAEFIACVRDICFPGYFSHIEKDIFEHKIKDLLYRIHDILPPQIHAGMAFCAKAQADGKDRSRHLALAFIERICEIKHLLATDAQAVLDNDPAAQNFDEVILCYPSIRAMYHHRIAHELFKLGIPILPRMISEMAHAETGIDIHPGAQIGEYFSIDHGTGVVIGQTAVIGHHVCLYQGVTLGARSFTYDNEGKPVDLPRHPIIEDHVTVYSNASILGRVTIGAHSIIGGNVWLTHSIPPYSRIQQQRAQSVSFTDGLGI